MARGIWGHAKQLSAMTTTTWRHRLVSWLRWLLSKVRLALLWHPLGRPVPATQDHKHPRLRRWTWAVAYRLALLPVMLAAAWVVVLTGVTHPDRQETDTSPDRFALTYRDVSFISADSVKLNGWYLNSLVPGNVLQDNKWKQLRPAVVLCHGYGATRDQLLYPIGKDLVQAGYDVLLMDFRGHGSSGDAPVSMGPTEVADVIAAVRFLQKQPGVNADRVGILGMGMGGYAAILAAPRCEGVRCVVAADTYPSVPTMLRQNFGRMHAPAVIGTTMGWGMSLYFGHRLLDDDAADAVQSFGDRALLLVTGQANTRTPAEDLEPIIAAGGVNTSRLIVPGAKHGQSLRNSWTTMMIVQYFDAYLAEDHKPSKVVIHQP